MAGSAIRGPRVSHIGRSASTTALQGVASSSRRSSSVLASVSTSAVQGQGPTTVIEEVGEVGEEEGGEDRVDEEVKDVRRPGFEPDGVDLTWALHARARSTVPVIDESGSIAGHGQPEGMANADEAEVIQEMRREMVRLQMDMLRMSRNLKNEIRRAVGPLVAEIQENKEVMERQRRELERLRRGY